MMKKQNSFQFWMSFITLHAFLLNPLAVQPVRANPVDDFHHTCDSIYAANTASSASSGLQIQANCDKAKMAVNARKAESAKVIIFGAAAAVMTALALTSVFTAGTSGTVCKSLSLATSVGAFAIDQTSEAKNGEVVGQFAEKAQTVTESMGAYGSASMLFGGKKGLLGTLLDNKIGQTTNKLADGLQEKMENHAANKIAEAKGMDSAPTGVKEIDIANTKKDEVFKAQQKKKATCLLGAVMMGVQASVSVIGLNGANKSIAVNVDEAQKAKDIMVKGGAISFNLNSNNDTTSAAGSTGNASKGATNNDCSTSKSYLNCINQGNISPELSAVTSNPNFMNTMQTALGGTSLDDFAKGYKGETKQDAANYIAQGLGMGQQGGLAVAKLMDLHDKNARDLGADTRYIPLAYARNAGASKTDDTLDYSKMMGDMLSKLNPDGSPVEKNKDPSQIVFRQMDLLPPESILQNPNISLFARIGYRINKNLANVEQNNWSAEQNKANSQPSGK